MPSGGQPEKRETASANGLCRSAAAPLPECSVKTLVRAYIAPLERWRKCILITEPSASKAHLEPGFAQDRTPLRILAALGRLMPGQQYLCAFALRQHGNADAPFSRQEDITRAPAGGGRSSLRRSRSGSVEAQAPAYLVFVHDGVGVAAGDAGVVRQPVRAFFAAQERGAGFKTMEPLSEVAAGDDRDTCDKAIVQIR
jgi:hypothetical protein